MAKQQPLQSSRKQWDHFSLLQFLSLVGVAFFGARHVLTAGEANRIFFRATGTAQATDSPPNDAHALLLSKHTAAPPFNKTLAENYFNLAMDGHFNTTAQKLMEPLQVMKDYTQQHSNQVLQSESLTEQQKRSYLVAWYSCPQHAGRRMHLLLNSLAWAVATNRTILVAYLNQEECLAHQHMWQKADTDCFNDTNTEQECREFMALQEWVPRFEDWSAKLLDLTNRSHTIVQADGITRRDPWARPMDQDSAPQFIHIGAGQTNLITGIDLTRPNLRAKLLSREDNRERTLNLFFYGYYFAYGLLLESLFTLRGVVPPEGERSTNAVQSLSFALHSRHARAKHEPAYNTLESICIRQLVQVHQHNNSCTVYIMSDSAARLDKLTKQVHDIGCEARYYKRHDMENDNSAAAGAAATNDVAFYQDWILLRDSVRHGFLAPHRKLRAGIGMRPSSALVREAVEFRRVLEGISDSSNSMQHRYHECFTKQDWVETGMTNCTPIERLASSFGLERHQQLHGIIKDPCVWQK